MPSREIAASHFLQESKDPDDHFADTDDRAEAWERLLYERRNAVLFRQHPETRLQALMETAPFQEPRLAKEDVIGVLDAIEEAIVALPERERYIFNALVVEKVSLRGLSARMGLSKTHLHRERNRICASLADALVDNEHVDAYLNT